MKLKIYLSCLLTMSSGLPSNAAETNEIAAASPATKLLTIETLTTEVLARNPELKFYEAEIRAAKAERQNAGTLANPELSGSIGQKSVRGGGISDEGIAWSVSLVQPFEWPGRIGLRKAIANRDVELAELGYARFKTALAGRARTLAFRLFIAQQKADAAAEVADRFSALRDVLVQRDPAGLTPLLETRVIEATELTMQRKATDAALARKSALLELNQLRGASADAPLEIVPTDLEFRAPENLNTLKALAFTNNFELRLRAVELAQQGFRLDLARNERFPAISIGPSFSEERAGERERTIGVGVSLPLTLWNRNRGNIEAALARQQQAEISFDVAAREVQRQVVEAALIYETRLRAINNWRPDAVEHFREAAQTADRHYRLGAVQISTYVELQQQYLEALESLLDTKLDALEAAQNLEALTGLTPPLTITKEKNQ